MPSDLPALASGGHLLRGAEALVRQGVEEVEQEEQEAATGADEACETRSAASALLALSDRVQYAPGVWMSPLAYLLLLRGDDEWVAGQGKREAGYGQGEEQEMREAVVEGGYA